MNWETYQKAYQATSPTIRELVDSEQIPLCSKNALEKRNLLLLRKKVAAEIASNTVGAQTIDETLENLIKLGVPDALQFFAEVQTCITRPAPKTTQTLTPMDMTAEISATEHDLAALHAVRTMAHDMEEVKAHPVVTPPAPEPVHQSSQADLLRQIETMASPNNTPRWDTEK